MKRWYAGVLMLRSLGQRQSVYLNGKPLGRDLARDAVGNSFDLEMPSLRPGRNVVAIVATPFASARGNGPLFRWDDTGPGAVRIATPATSQGLTPADLKISAVAKAPRMALASQ